jgi:tRNA pseudouridine synthase 10
VNAVDRYGFDTFLIGCRPPADVVEAEEDLWEQVGVQWVEPIKSEVNRWIGKRLEAETDATVDFERPDINAVLDIAKDRVELQVNSLLIYGIYNKYSRELPQTKWPCGNCRGSGCDECDWTGKQYQESVEELIADPFLEETRAVESKFHGAGREDVDAKCLGQREFVLEILEPVVRDIDLKDLEQRINDQYGDKIEVFDLQFTEKDMVEQVKSRRADKTYRAVVQFDDPVSDEQLEQLATIVGTVQQETPTRVEHRRADKVREREVHEIDWERLDDNRIALTVNAAAGTYIKELISGDDDRTEPSVSGVLGTDAECVELDVIAIEKPESAPAA